MPDASDQLALQLSLNDMKLNCDRTHVENMSRFLGSEGGKTILAELDISYWISV
jgi:hypothetical protein